MEEGILREWMPQEFIAVWRAWPNMGVVSASAVRTLEKFQRLLDVDEKEKGRGG